MPARIYPKHKLINYHAPLKTAAKLDGMAEYHGISRTAMITKAIEDAWVDYQADLTEAKLHELEEHELSI